MARSVDAIIEAANKRMAKNIRADLTVHLLPPAPRRRKEKKTRVAISARLTEQDCARLDALCAECNMSRAAMIVELHKFSTQKKKISKRQDKIDQEIARLTDEEGANEKR